ncbi:DUF4041 domain-containing protein [Escherichia coli]|uniref:DUF4041 domain-containing protein n=1 Tax=Escherichia coli TaxID=562 RepID=UPI0027E582EC|nr:DUF4041 domain-containing protein [Escherichia coli]
MMLQLAIARGKHHKMEERITKAFEAINKLNEQNHIYINTKYLNKNLRNCGLPMNIVSKNRKKKKNRQK